MSEETMDAQSVAVTYNIAHMNAAVSSRRVIKVAKDLKIQGRKVYGMIGVRYTYAEASRICSEIAHQIAEKSRSKRRTHAG